MSEASLIGDGESILCTKLLGSGNEPFESACRLYSPMAKSVMREKIFWGSMLMEYGLVKEIT